MFLISAKHQIVYVAQFVTAWTAKPVRITGKFNVTISD